MSRIDETEEINKSGMDAKSGMSVTVVADINEIDAAAWNACANPDARSFDPFVSHGFLQALEEAGTITQRSGWLARHLVLSDGAALDGAGEIVGCMPLYLKFHSAGEFVFDHGWADAYANAGGQYYPKLQCCVPFSPVPGRRLLVRPGAEAQMNERILARAAIELTTQLGASSLHITFASQGEWRRLGGHAGTGCDQVIPGALIAAGSNIDADFLQRTGSQFHWFNNDYDSFDDFLAALSSRKRKAIRKERKQALSAGIDIRHLRGADITQAHWDQFYEFYLDTSTRKWGQAYLTRDFFARLGATLGERCLLILCEREGTPIAGALNLIGGDCIYGRYWGAIEHHPCLHFEVCYYQAIEIAIAWGLSRVEAGAQGQHKLVRGYQPVPTYSLHWIAQPNFRAAVADFLRHERKHMALEREALTNFTPFKKATQ